MQHPHNVHSTGGHIFSAVMSGVQQHGHRNVSNNAVMGDSRDSHETQDVHNAAAAFGHAIKDGETSIDAPSQNFVQFI